MTIFTAYSAPLKDKALELKARLEVAGHKVCMAVISGLDTELEYHQVNAKLMGGCELVFALWNGISDGCPMDVAMGISLGKPVYAEVICTDRTRICRQTKGCTYMTRAWALFSELPNIEEW